MRSEYIREFIEAATYLNFTTAAKRLYSSQPKISAHIASMEKELGFKLFNRGDRLTLTREGKHFFNGVVDMMQTYDWLVKECKTKGSLSPARLFMGEFSLFEMFPTKALLLHAHAIDLLSKQHNNAIDTSSVPIDNNMLISELLVQGVFDYSFRSLCLPEASDTIIDIDDGTSALPLVMDDMVVWMRAEHPLAAYDAVPVSKLENYPVLLANCPSMATWVRTRIDFFDAHNVHALFKTKTVSTPSMFITPLDNDDIYLVAEEFLKAPRINLLTNMVSRPIADTHAQSCFCLCWSTNTHNATVLELVELMRELKASDL